MDWYDGEQYCVDLGETIGSVTSRPDMKSCQTCMRDNREVTPPLTIQNNKSERHLYCRCLSFYRWRDLLSELAIYSGSQWMRERVMLNIYKWVRFLNHPHFYFSYVNYTCRSKDLFDFLITGGHLVSINSLEEENWVNTLVEAFDGRSLTYWLGGQPSGTALSEKSFHSTITWYSSESVY